MVVEYPESTCLEIFSLTYCARPSFSSSHLGVMKYLYKTASKSRKHTNTVRTINFRFLRFASRGATNPSKVEIACAGTGASRAGGLGVSSAIGNPKCVDCWWVIIQ